MASPPSRRAYPDQLRKVTVFDAERNKYVAFLTNYFTLPAHTVADLYRKRWGIEIFFRWVKQHLRIKRFFGTSPNAVKTQLWIAIATYVLAAILKKRLGLPVSLYTLLQYLNVSVFEQVSIAEALTHISANQNESDFVNQADTRACRARGMSY